MTFKSPRKNFRAVFFATREYTRTSPARKLFRPLIFPVPRSLPSCSIHQEGSPPNHGHGGGDLDAVYQVMEHFGQHYGQIVYISKAISGADLGF
jgi:hypothetical protein